MKKSKFIFVACLFSVTMFVTCAKDNKDDESDTTSYPSTLTGTIYYGWQDISQISLPDGTGGTFISKNRDLSSFDVSYGRNYKLTVEDDSRMGDSKVKITLSNLSDGAIVEQFSYKSPSGGTSIYGTLSPDNSFIMVTSKRPKDGITILKRNGELVARLLDIEGQMLDMSKTICNWLPDNSLLMTHNNQIIKIESHFQSGKVIKEMNYQDWDKLTVNQAGTQMALCIDKHIYTMAMDGSNLKQVTTSNFGESEPVFSPDGKYILLGAEYRRTEISSSWKLKIIPNDGKLYNVDPLQANSPGVIPVKWNGRDDIVYAAGQVIWR